MKTIIKLLKDYILFIPRAGSLFLEDLLYTIQKNSKRRQDIEKQIRVINTLKSLNLTKMYEIDRKQSIYFALNEDYEEVITCLVNIIHKEKKS